MSFFAYEERPLSPHGEPTGSEPRQDVGEDAAYLSGADWGLSDEEREERIERLGALMVSAMEQWERSGEFFYRGDADRLRMRMEALIKARPAGYVRRLEAERGLV